MEKEKALNNAIIALGEIFEAKNAEIYQLQMDNLRKTQQIQEMKKEISSLHELLKEKIEIHHIQIG